MAYFPNYPNLFGYQNPYQMPTTQNGGFVTVRSEDEARNYPVAPGNSVTFRNESAPYIYTKTAGSSPLDHPVFDRYRLVKEEAEPVSAPVIDTDFVKKTEFDALKAEFEKLRTEIGNNLSEKVKKNEFE